MAGTRMNAGDRRRAILEAALRVIARTNYSKATTAAIAKEAGINEALIYHHFESKKVLLLALLDMIKDDITAILTSVEIPDDPSLTAFRVVGKHYQNVVEEDPDGIKAFIKATVVDDQEVKDKVWEILESFHGMVKTRIEEARDAGMLPPFVDTEMAAWMSLAWANFISLTRVLGKGDRIPDERIDQWVERMEGMMSLARKMSGQPQAVSKPKKKKTTSKGRAKKSFSRKKS